MAETNTTNSGFEKQIWDAACVLRGNLDASEYKSVVLGLIFLKYISDRFEAKYNELVAEGDGFEEDIDEYTSENIFFVPESARWKVIAAAAHTPEIGKVIDDAMRAIEKENKKLKDILPKNFARPELDKRRLGDVVIENLSYETIIPRYDGAGTLLYLDPPYYQAECYDVPFCLLDHMRLHSLVCGCRNAFVALSYNDHPVIRELYQGFWQFTTSRPNPLRNRSGGGRYEELIITNYDPEVWSRPPQLSLFQGPEKGPGEQYHPIQKGENNAELRKWRGKQVRRRLQKSLWR